MVKGARNTRWQKEKRSVYKVREGAWVFTNPWPPKRLVRSFIRKGFLRSNDLLKMREMVFLARGADLTSVCVQWSVLEGPVSPVKVQ